MIQEVVIQHKKESSEVSGSSSVLNIYQSITLSSLDRLLSLLDRNPYSRTYGSFSRNYWHYKILADFPSSTDQQGVLALSCLYLLNLKSNNFYLNPELLKLIEAGINYWTKLQSKDGSFSEWYPNEHSHVATAFTSYAISESLLLLKDKINVKILEKAINTLKKAGYWLNKNIDITALNHTAGGVAALYNIYLLTKEKKYLEGCQKNLNTLVRLQDKEGWFPEYGGADPGYLGVSIDYLAKYWYKSHDPILEKSLRKALDFLVWFYQDDLKTTGGEFGSRNVKYMLPHGLILLSNQFNSAKYLESNLRNSLDNNKDNKVISPTTIDDRYFLFFHYPNYAQASLVDLPKEDFNHYRPKSFLKVFPSSGLISCKQENHHFIVNLKKGGILKLNLKSDCGYFASLKDSDKVLTTQTLSQITQLQENEKLPFSISIKTNFVECDFREPYLKSLLIPFRVFNYLFGQSNLIMSIFNKLIKEKLIYQTKKANLLTLYRNISIDEKKITIEDNLKSEVSGLLLDKLVIEPNISLMHVPSSKYFHFNDLNKESNFNPCNLADIFNKHGKASVKRIVNLSENDTDVKLIIA